MNTKKLALSAASLVLILAFLACRAPGLGGGAAPTFTISEGAGSAGPALSTPAPDVPTNTDGAETIIIPGGTFWMGSDDSDTQADDDEKPRHQVTVGTFPIYTHEVTNAMYARCVEAGACIPIPVLEGAPASHLGDPEYSEHPVVGVDWNMADDYCAWANSRLPTEAEWEYAARGTDSLLYPWGTETPACDRLNMSGCQTPPGTVPVGSYLLGNSPFEAWDMAGNVWEWTHDWYDPDYYALSPSSSPIGPNLPDDPNHPQKVARGGGLNSEPAAVRGAARIGGNPLRSYDDIGFRCVAQPPLDLPNGYAEVPEGHEWVPPDSIEEDDGDSPWVVVMGGGRFTCPDAEGRVRYSQMTTSSVDPTAFSASVGGVPLDCTFDPAADLLSCSGFPPPEYDTWGPEVDVEVCFSHAYGAGCMTNHASKPDDCPPEGTEPLEITATADCPNDAGQVTVIFHYATALLPDEILLDGADVPWWPLGEHQTNTIVPARDPGDTYAFYFRGTGTDGTAYEAWTSAAIPLACPPMRAVLLTPLCLEDHPAVEVRTTPATLHVESASVSGTPLACHAVAPGVQVCGDLPGEPGSAATVTLCFEVGPCEDFPVTIPECPGEAEYGYILDTVCVPPGTPAASLHYWPFDEPLASVEAASVPLTCDDWGGGWYMCTGLPGAPGTSETFTFTTADGTLIADAITVPDCGEEESTGDAFRFVGAGCHDETHIFFIVDTGLAWLVPGAGFSQGSEDGESTYTCSVHPTIAGRLYCSGIRPVSPGALQLRVQRDGDPPPPHSGRFEDWPAQVAAIPDCSPEEPPPSVDACSVWPQSTCEKDHFPCRWSPTRGCYTP